MRRPHQVWETQDADFVVSVTDGHGQVHENRVAQETVEWFSARLAGNEVDKNDAGRALKPVASRFRLPFTYGYKLAFYAQDVLLVLVALEKATYRKEGRRFLYSIR